MKQFFPVAKDAKRRLLTIITIVTIMCLSAAARGWSANNLVFPDDGSTHLLGVDALFHVRHSYEVLQNFPYIGEWDKRASFPRVKKNHAAGLMHIGIASLSYILHGVEASIQQVASIAAWTIFLIGTLNVFLLYLLSRLFFDRFFSALATLIFILHPAEYLTKSALGFADQHVFEVFFILMSLIMICRCLQLSTKFEVRQLIVSSSAAALPFLLLSYTWQGAVIYLPLIACSVLALVTYKIYFNESVDGIKNSLIYYTSFVVLCFTVINTIFPWLQLSPKGMRGLVYGSLFLGISAWLYISVLKRYNLSNTKLTATIGFTGVVIFCLAFLLNTGIGQSVVSVLLSQKGELIAEQKPVTLYDWFTELGLVGLLSLLSLPLLVIFLKKYKLKESLLLPITFGTLLHLLWIRTGDYGYMVPAFAAFQATFVLRILKPIRHYKRFCVAGAIILIVMFYPSRFIKYPWVTAEDARLTQIYSDGWYEASKWLKLHTPKTEWQNNKANYGIITAWEFGNILPAFADRVPVWSRYPTKSIPHWLTAQNETASLGWLCRLCEADQRVKYAIVDAQSYGGLFATKAKMAGLDLTLVEQGEIQDGEQLIPRLTYNTNYGDSLVSKLYAHDGNGLQHYRLIYETTHEHYITTHLQPVDDKYDVKRLTIPVGSEPEKANYLRYLDSDVVKHNDSYLYDGAILPSVKIYEIVSGAYIVGSAQAGTHVQVQLPLKVSATNREFMYQQTVVANKEGVYKITVPYPTISVLTDYDVTALSNYLLSVKRPGENAFTPYGRFDVKEENLYK